MGKGAGIPYTDPKELNITMAILIITVLTVVYIVPLTIYPLEAFNKYLFTIKLNRCAKKRGYSVTKLNGPFRSLFKSYPGADLILDKGEETICIKYLPYHSASKVVHISKNTVYIARKKKLAKQWEVCKEKYNNVSVKAIEKLMEKHSLKRKINLSFNAKQNSKCIIVYPPSVVYMRYAYKTDWIVVDNGVEYLGGARFYDYKRLLAKIEEELL